MWSCLPPTEIVVDISTDVACSDLGGVAIASSDVTTIDAVDPFTITPSCDAGKIGRIVFVPSSIDGDVGIRVVGGFKKQASNCKTPFGAGCIVARRALRYVPHTPLYLPIVLSASCAGVPCDTTSTCVDGQCVPANIDDPTKCESADAGCVPSGGLSPECGDTSGLASTASWPMSAVCPTHIARTPYVGPVVAPRQLWDHPDNLAPQYSLPVITGDGTAVFGTQSGNVVGLDLDTGATKWTLAAAAAVGGNGALAADGSVVIGAGNGLFDIDLATHTQKWSVTLRGADATIGPAGVYVATQGVLHAFDVASGKELWTAATKASAGANFASPAISPDGARIYLGADDAYFGIIDATTHAPIFETVLESIALPMAVADRVYAPSAPTLSVFTKDGTLLWTLPNIVGRAVALAKDGTVVVATSGHIGAYDAAGTPVWSLPVPADLSSNLVIDGSGVIYGITTQFDLVAIDPKSGVKWSVSAPQAFDLAIGKSGTLLVITNDGHVIAFR